MQFNLFLEEFILSYGLFSIFLVMVLEYSNIPLPGSIVLPMIGVTTAKYHMNLAIVLLISILGALVGTLISYYLGYRFGQKLVLSIQRKYPQTKIAIKRSYDWLNKYGKLAVMLTRLVPIVRTFISLIAGVTKINLSSFVIYSGIGISIWNTALILLGYFVGDNVHIIISILTDYSILLLIIVFIATILFIIFRKKLCTLFKK